MNQAIYPVSMMCRLLGVSTSGFYSWLKRPLSERQQTDADLLLRIRRSHARSDGTYGVPRIYEDLYEEGIRVGRKRMHGLCNKPVLGAFVAENERRRHEGPGLIDLQQI